MLIYKKIIAVMKSIDAVTKSRKNQAQGYNFRGIDDVYNELHTPLAENGVFSVPEILEERTEERTTSKGSVLIYRILKIKFTFYAEDGSNLSAVVIGEGMDSGDKASNKAMSVAHKYAFMQIFAIPTEEDKDPERESHIVAPKTVAKPAAETRIFHKENQKAVDWLLNHLNKTGIDTTEHQFFLETMDGRDIRELDALIKIQKDKYLGK